MGEQRKKTRTRHKRPAGIQSMDLKLYEQLQQAIRQMAAATARGARATS